MKRKEKAGNLLAGIHLENYDARYNPQNLNHRTMVYTRGRACEDLNGLWRFVVDPYDQGLRSGWHIREQKDETGRRIPWDYDVNDGETIPVPSCWNLVKPEWFYYEGSVWYARAFSYKPESEGERVFLRIGAANYDAKIFLNQSFLGNHYGGSTPFFVELTGKLQAENILQICVNNTRTLDRVPMRNTDWFNYGGIYRDVALYRLPADFIRDFFIYLVPDDGYDKLRLFAEVADKKSEDELTLEIPELRVRATVRARDGVAEGVVAAQPELWSPENPRLYDVSLSYHNDRVTDRVGFRQIDVRGRRIRLNGKPVYLRGISVHEDDAVLGKATSEENIRRMFADAKELGCNYVRLAHYPHDERVAQIADEVGIMLWEEIPVYWAIDFSNPATYRDAENQLIELIKRDRNRCSVIFWSVGNENADTDARLKFMGDLARTAKKWDPSRLVTAACLANQAELRIEDRLAAQLDVIGLNEYYGWYNPDFDNLCRLMENSDPDKPVVISETGADGLAGYHGDKTEMFTEEFMTEVYERQIALLREVDYVQGISPWILYDFRTPRRTNRFQRGYNRKGLIAEDKRTRKSAFYVLQRFYSEKAAEEA